MKLGAGKCYRTRDGRKAGPLLASPGPPSDWAFEGDLSGSGNTYCYWRSDGSVGPASMHPDGTALVALWEDPTVAKQETELERLVRVANEGSLASKRLTFEYTDQVEEFYPDGVWQRPQEGDYAVFRIKLRPVFQSISVISNGTHLVVSLSDDEKTLRVGCKQFPLSEARVALEAILRRGVSSYGLSASPSLNATRDGIFYMGTTLSYSECDRILAALEAHFGKKEAL